MIKAILFDIDGVLLDSFEANLKFFQDLAVFAGYTPVDREQYPELYHLTMEELIRRTMSDDPAEVQRVWTLGKTRVVPYPNQLLSMPVNLNSTLHDLADKYLLAIVTSRINGSVYSVPQLAPLESLFVTTVYFEDTKKHKPEPEPLLLACQRLSVLPVEAVYVGDTQADAQAAAATNMKSIIYRGASVVGADAAVDSFEQISELVTTL